MLSEPRRRERNSHSTCAGDDTRSDVIIFFFLNLLPSNSALLGLKVENWNDFVFVGAHYAAFEHRLRQEATGGQDRGDMVTGGEISSILVAEITVACISRL